MEEKVNTSSESLVRFFVFNSSYGSKEGQEAKKILYYWSKNPETEDERVKSVGLVEAVVRFGSEFGSKTVRSLATRKTKTFFYSPERDFWMAFTMNVPKKLVEKKGKSEGVMEYRLDDLPETIYLPVLIRVYRFFLFFSGPIGENASEDDAKSKVSDFFSKYFNAFKPKESDIFDALLHIKFMSLEPLSFLKVKVFIDSIQRRFPDCYGLSFLHDGNMVWTGLQQDDAVLLYHYLITSVFSADKPSKDEIDTIKIPDSGHWGTFLIGPESSNETFEDIPVGRIGPELEKRRLIVYRALLSTIVFTFPVSKTMSPEIFKDIDDFVGSTLTTLSADLMNVFKKQPDSNPADDLGTKFIYYNDHNKALKSTILAGSGSEIIQVVSDLHSDIKKLSAFSEDEEFLSEISVKTNQDSWVIAKSSDDRKVFVIITNKSYNLIDSSAELTKLMSEEFKSIYLIDK